MDGEIGHEELASILETTGEGGDESDATEPGVRIVDVRDPSAFARAHVPGSENVPFGRLVEDVERFAGADRVVTICPHGKASVKAARLIAAYEGFEGRVESFAPGLSEWEGPLETDESVREDDSVAGDDGERPSDHAERGSDQVERGSDEGPTAPF